MALRQSRPYMPAEVARQMNGEFLDYKRLGASAAVAVAVEGEGTCLWCCGMTGWGRVYCVRLDIDVCDSCLHEWVSVRTCRQR